MTRHLNNYALIASALVCSATLFGCAQPPPQTDVELMAELPASDAPIVTDYTQLPELPTGCEATALAALLQLNGVDVSKTDVADVMPKSDSDFVNAFLGDPYSEDGGCCMSPCVANTAEVFLDDANLTAYQTEGLELSELPTPCVIWMTIDLAEPQLIKTQGAYGMYYPSHCVVLLDITGDYARCIDPLKGYIDYPLDRLSEVYTALGSQAVYLGED